MTLRCSLFTALSVVAVTGTTGRAQNFQPGEIVGTQYCGKPIEVKVIKEDSIGVLVLTRDWQDGTFKEGGSTRYYQASELSHLQPAAAKPSAAATDSGAGAALQGAGAYGGATAQQGDAAAAAAELGGSGPLSKQQILSYLAANVGTDGMHPKREAISKAVVEAIKKRGVNFKSSWKDIPDFIKAGADTTVNYAIQDNYGEPVKLNWLIGAWELQFTNATGFFASRESASKLGFVSIEPSHSFIWKIHEDDPATKWIEGKWREATPEEMKYQGGAGVVLLNGEQGWDWIVHKDMTAAPGQDWINVADIDTRQVKRGGLRK